MKRLPSMALLLALSFFPWQAAGAEEGGHDFRTRRSQQAVFETESDVEAEIEFGKELAARILGKYRLYEDEKATRYINLIGKGLAAQSSRPEIEFRFGILNTDVINAFATPGGYIFVTTGTLKLMDNEAQLAGVLAHEIAHVTEKHIVRELEIKGTDTSASAGFAAILGGGTAETLRATFTQLVDKASAILFEKGLKKDDELESDRLAVLLSANAGYNPLAYRDLLKKIGNQGEKTEKSKKMRRGRTEEKEVQATEANTKILSDTHPTIMDRLVSLELLISTEGLSNLNLADVKERFHAHISL